LIQAAGHRSWDAFFQEFVQTEVTALWWITVAVLTVVSNKRVHLIGLSILLLIALYALVAFWTPR
jgi:hypothetical protein